MDREFHVWLAKDPSSTKLKIVLSPSFYIAKTSPIRFESIKKAQKAAASVFEDSLPDENFAFEAHTHTDLGYLFLAIDFENALKKADSLMHGYKKIEFYTAQSVFRKQTFPLCIEEGQNLVSIDGVILNSFLKDEGAKIEVLKLDFSNKLDFFKTSNLNDKAVKTLLISASFFTAILGVDASYNFYRAFKAENSVKEQREAKNLPPTNMELESSIRSLSKIEKEQMNARVFIKKLLSFELEANENIKSLKIEKNGYEIEINTKRGEAIKKHIAERFKIEGSVASENSLYLKVSI